MTEAQVGQQEQRRHSEILDFDKYGAVYGRFLLASLPGAEVTNIIDPANATLTFDNMGLDALDERDYNPVCTESSIAERKEQWKDVEFSDAYSKWKTEFTSFMNNNKNSNHKSALGIIMGNPNEPVENFTEPMAEKLFNTYCGDRSDIDSFVKTVARDLADNNGKIDPTKLQELLPELQWIASGLFGKQTASQVVTRLIELESAVFHSPGHTPQFTLDLFNHNKGRINDLTVDEKRILTPLYKSLIQEAERVPAQVAAVTIPTVPATDTPKPAPVTPKPDEDEDKDKPPPPTATVSESKGTVSDEAPAPPPTLGVPESEEKSLQDMNLQELMEVRDKMLSEFSKEDRDTLYSEALEMTEDEINKMPSEKKVKTQNDREEMLRMDIANLRTILKEEGLLINAQPQPAKEPVNEMTHEETEEIGGISSFEDNLLEWQHKNHKIRINRAFTNISWAIFFSVNNESVTNNGGLYSQKFDLASALKMFETKGLEPNTAEKIYQALAKSFLNGIKAKDSVFLNLLKKFPNTLVIGPDGKEIHILATWGWGQSDELVYIDMNMKKLDEGEIKKLDPETIRLLNVGIGKAALETWIKSSATPTAPTAAIESIPKPETDEERRFEETNRVRDRIREKELAGVQEDNGDIASPTADQRVPATENIRNMVDIEPEPADLREALNQFLSRNKDKPNITFSVSPNELKEYIISMAKGSDITGGNIIVGGDNLLIIGGLRITKLGAGVTLDLLLSNDKDGIRADITKFHRDFRARVKKASSREEVERQIQNINFAIKKRLDEEISNDNSRWKTKKVSILDGKVLIEFEKALLFAS